MDLSTKALQLLENCTPAGVIVEEELPRIKATLGQHFGTTFDIQKTDTFRGHDNKQYPFRGFKKLACAFNFGSTVGLVILDGNEALVLVHGSTLNEWGYREDAVKFGVSNSTVTGQPLTFGADPANGQFYFSRKGMVQLNPPKADPLDGRTEAEKVGKIRKAMHDLNSVYSAYVAEVESRARQVQNLEREKERNDEVIDSTDSKCRRLDSKIAEWEAKIRKGKASADRMARMTGEVHRLGLSHDGFAKAFDSAEARNAEIAKEVKELRKAVPIPDALKTFLKTG